MSTLIDLLSFRRRHIPALVQFNPDISSVCTLYISCCSLKRTLQSSDPLICIHINNCNCLTFVHIIVHKDSFS